ncbi:hypothetical protein M0804_010916 [Polistes exclamans]|nr:hypothetical protein M0804_010916 [Polistes exclamans]
MDSRDDGVCICRRVDEEVKPIGTPPPPPPPPVPGPPPPPTAARATYRCQGNHDLVPRNQPRNPKCTPSSPTPQTP